MNYDRIGAKPQDPELRHSIKAGLVASLAFEISTAMTSPCIRSATFHCFSNIAQGIEWSKTQRMRYRSGSGEWRVSNVL